MIKKWVQKHNFINDKPIIPFIYNGTDGYIVSEDFITIGDNNNTYITNPTITLSDLNGGDIFSVSNEGIYYQQQRLVTEDRLREIVREIMEELTNNPNRITE